MSWQPDPTADGFTSGPGYWAVVRHADVLAVSTDPESFSSAPTASIRDLPPDLGEYLGSMLHMDDPRHAALRRVVSQAFTPRRLTGIQELIASAATEAVDLACDAGTCDAVEAIAAPVPLQVICELMGIPRSDRDAVSRHGQTLSVARDSASMMAAAKATHDIAERLAEERRSEPGNDLTSALVHANVEGASLTPTEIGSFFLLLIVAGAQTTRHAIAHGLVALAEHEDQRRRWLADPDTLTPTAVDEILRWASPVSHFRRTATRDTVIGSTKVRAGDKVVLWYASANRDEAVFPDPERFDVTRHPNPHVAFGAGPHYCLGAQLAKQEIAAVFARLLDRAPQWRVDRARLTPSSFVSGYEVVETRFCP